MLGPAAAKWQGWGVQKLILNPNIETKQCLQRAKETKRYRTKFMFTNFMQCPQFCVDLNQTLCGYWAV